MTAKIKWAELSELVWVAPLAALAVCTAFSLLVLGTARAGDRRRDGATVAAVGYSALAAAGGALVVAGVVFGLQVIAS
jgi:hypothetical protein